MGIPLLGVLPVSEGLLSSLRVVQQHAERVIFWTAEQEDVGNYRGDLPDSYTAHLSVWWMRCGSPYRLRRRATQVIRGVAECFARS
jgi:hypothetical protein